MKEERNKSETECERLKRLLDENISTLKGLEKEARNLDSQNSKLENIMLIAEKDHSTVKIGVIIVGWVDEKP